MSNLNEDFTKMPYKNIEKSLSINNYSDENLIENNKLITIRQLAAGVAHEFNTPLANIILIVEYIMKLIKIQKFSFDLGILQKELMQIKNQVYFCSKIVRSLLKFSKQININLKRFKYYSLLTEILESHDLSSRIKELGVKIIIKIDKTTEILGDRKLLYQVFLNILNNSIDALYGVNHEREIQITLSKSDNKFEIKVIDNGIGIKKADISRVFEPFFTTKPVGKANGLGLPICSGVIEKHNGNIKINSEFGHGTEVIISLPIY